MRSFDPTDQEDVQTAKDLNAPSWMLQQLQVNPSYVYWGPHEDYMMDGGAGWRAPVSRKTWSEGKPLLDELNEVVNFYFLIDRDSVACGKCGGDGVHPDAQWVSHSWYSFQSPFAQGLFPSDETLRRYSQEFRDFCYEMLRILHWDDAITEEEARALVASGRGEGKTANQFNAEQRGRGFGHDAINKHIVVTERCRRYGLPYTCPDCKGNGYLYTAEDCRLVLTLWVIHPRKGCSRGWEITDVKQGDLLEVRRFLREAAERNHQRFAKIFGEELEERQREGK